LTRRGPAAMASSFSALWPSAVQALRPYWSNSCLPFDMRDRPPAARVHTFRPARMNGVGSDIAFARALRGRGSRMRKHDERGIASRQAVSRTRGAGRDIDDCLRKTARAWQRTSQRERRMHFAQEHAADFGQHVFGRAPRAANNCGGR